MKKIIPKISIIVPVYNADKYLYRCIESVLSQSFSDFELLLINDGSQDFSGIICDKFAISDKRIRVFHKDNEGVSSARNLGIKFVNYKYIMFLDADDTLYCDCLDNFVSLICKYPEYSFYAANFTMQNYKNEIFKYIKKYSEYEGEITDPLNEVVEGGMYIRPGSFLTTSKKYFNAEITIYEDLAYVFDNLEGLKLCYSDFRSVNYYLSQNGASIQFHKYYSEWIYCLESKCLKKYFKYFFKHFLQRIYVHLLKKDLHGAFILILNYGNKITKNVCL